MAVRDEMIGGSVGGWVAVGAAFVVWLSAYVGWRRHTTPRLPSPAPDGTTPGPESPAVVSLLINRWKRSPDAPVAVLHDLVDRGHLVLSPAGAVSLIDGIDDDLRDYERLVLARVRDVSGDQVPLGALAFRNPAHASAFSRRFAAAVLAEARAAGLSQPRVNRTARTVGTLLAAAAGLAAARAVPHSVGVGIFVFVVLAVISWHDLGDHATPAGRAAAARWLAVRSGPPAYGIALGRTPASFSLGLGDRNLVWSSTGGSWHRVRVHYPRTRFWHGRTTPELLAGAGGFLVGAAAVHYALGRWFPAAVVAVALATAGAYILVRALGDVSSTRTVTGEVIWRESWKVHQGSDDAPDRPWLDHLVLDEGAGSAEVWGLPLPPAEPCADGDVVTISVRPWTRRVRTVTTVSVRDS